MQKFIIEIKKFGCLAIAHFVKIECVYCHSFIVARFGLCGVCENKIFQQDLNPYHMQVCNSDVLSLYDWIPGLSNELSALVTSLKSKLRFNEWSQLADEFIRFHGLDKDLVKNTVLVPIPSSTGRRHSHYFAKALASKLGCQAVSCLKLQPESLKSASQKHLKKTEREKIRFTLSEEFTSELCQYKQIVLIDDVVTTGSSFKAAANALYEKLHIPSVLWVAFRRVL